MRIKVTEDEAQDYLDKFFQTYPGVKQYIETTKNFVRQYHFAYTYTGRRRRFPIIGLDRKSASRISRQAVNARIQSTSSDIVMTNLVDLDRAIQPLGGRILLTVHDSIVFQLPKNTSGVKPILDQIVLENTSSRFPWLPVQWKYDCGSGPNYGEAHDEVK